MSAAARWRGQGIAVVTVGMDMSMLDTATASPDAGAASMAPRLRDDASALFKHLVSGAALALSGQSLVL
jgi:hypothetical protein